MSSSSMLLFRVICRSDSSKSTYRHYSYAVAAVGHRNITAMYNRRQLSSLVSSTTTKASINNSEIIQGGSFQKEICRMMSSSSSSSSSLSSMFRTNFNFMDDEMNTNSFTGSPMETKEDVEVPLSEREMKRQRAAMKLQQLDEERERLRTKKGRGWSDPWDFDAFIESGADHKSLLEWAPEYVSRISQERVQIYSSKKDGSTIPTLTELATDISLPLPPPPNPAQHMKAYALYRKRYIQKYIYTRVVEYAAPKVNAILKLPDWDSKQDAIDILYEQVEFALRDKETILSKQPNFGTMVERAIEQYLRTVQKELKEKAAGNSNNNSNINNNNNAAGSTLLNSLSGDGTPSTTSPLISEQKKIEQRRKDEMAVPIFIDCYNKNVDKPDVPVPQILIPMKCSVPMKPMQGRVVEEWELSALKTSKRIMLRQCTRTIAQIITNATTKNDTYYDFSRSNSSNETLATTTTRLEDSIGKDSSSLSISSEGTQTATSTIEKSAISTLSSNQPLSARILVHGVQGVGKTAVLASIVACARKSGAIVLFIPDGNQMHQNGFYIEPDDKRTGIFNLPILSQTVCQHLVASHEKEMNDFLVEAAVVETFFTESQIRKLKEYTVGTSINLVSLLNNGIERTDLAPMCYSAAMHVLMTQSERDFIMVLDEGNCFYIPQGHYYHEAFDVDVKKSIPYHQINLFEPFLNTMNITSLQGNDDNYSPTLDAATTSLLPSHIQRGAVIISTTESHAIPRIVTDTLIANAKIVAADAASPSTLPQLHVVEVPRLTTIEVQHMLSNYEATGVGFLRLDRGETVMNNNEVSYLHMVSGGIPQHLMNACMME